MKYIGTTTTLASGATWDSSNAGTTPTLSDTADRLTGTVFSDQVGTLFIEQSGDGANWDVSTTYTVIAGDGSGFAEEVVAPYLRLRFTNTSGSPQTAFRVHARLSSSGVKA